MCPLSMSRKRERERGREIERETFGDGTRGKLRVQRGPDRGGGRENGTMRLKERSNRFTRGRCPHLQTRSLVADAFEDDGMSVRLKIFSGKGRGPRER